MTVAPRTIPTVSPGTIRAARNGFANATSRMNPKYSATTATVRITASRVRAAAMAPSPSSSPCGRGAFVTSGRLPATRSGVALSVGVLDDLGLLERDEPAASGGLDH